MSKKVLEEKTKTIELTPFPYDLVLVVTTDIQASEQKVRQKHGDLCSKLVSNERTGALSLYSPNSRFMHILMPFKCDIGYIAHEVWHIVRALLLQSGATLDNEVVAYYIGWLVREVTRFNFNKTKEREKLLAPVTKVDIVVPPVVE